MKSDLDSTAAAHSGLLRKSWHRFNRWRKRYVWIRLLFLVLLGAFVCKEAFSPIIPEVYSFNGVPTYTLPGMGPAFVFEMARLKRLRLSQQLKSSLRQAVDRDGDGSLDGVEIGRAQDLGLDGEDLQKTSPQLDLARLIDASHRARLLPTSFTYGVARWEAFFAAQGEAEVLAAQSQNEIQNDLRTWEMPDYLQWRTWRRGAVRFAQWALLPVFELGRPRTVAAWLMVCFFVSLAASVLCPKAGTLVAVGLAGSSYPLFRLYSFSGTWFFPLHSDYLYFKQSLVYTTVGFISLSLACALCGSRVGRPHHPKRLILCGSLLDLGMVLLAWRFGLGPFGGSVWENCELSDWFAEVHFNYDRIVRSNVPDWVHAGSVFLGAVCLALGLMAFAFYLWTARRRVRYSAPGGSARVRPSE